MLFVLVHYAVTDYARWRAVFDADTIKQRDAGVQIRYVLRDEKIPNRITLLAQVKDRKRAVHLSQRRELPDLIKKAGVLQPIKYEWLREGT